MPIPPILFYPCLVALQPAAEPHHARPTLVSETTTAAPGATLWLAFDFEIDPGWHTYWAGQNDTGAALKAEVEVANGAAGDLVWPAPQRYSPFEGILDHVYEGRMVVLLPVEVAADAKPGDKVRVEADLDWLVCESVCLPESRALSIEVPIAGGPPAGNPAAAEAFRLARSRLPEALKPDDAVRIEFDDPHLSVHAIGAERVAFYPMADSRRPRRAYEECQAEGETLRIEFRAGDEPVAGILEVWGRVRDGARDSSRLFEVRWPESAAAPEPKR